MVMFCKDITEREDNQDAADVAAAGIRQMPTFFLNGKRLENFSADSLIADTRVADIRIAVGNS